MQVDRFTVKALEFSVQGFGVLSGLSGKLRRISHEFVGTGLFRWGSCKGDTGVSKN